MDFSLIIPVLVGWLAGWLINYLADVLPGTLKLGRPTCLDPACAQPYAWGSYLLLRGCKKCGRGRSTRAFIVQILGMAAAVYIWLVPPESIGFVPGYILLAYLLTVAIIDLEHRLILGPLSIVGLILAIIVGLLAHGWKSMLIGGVAGFLIMYLFYYAGKIFTRLRARRLGLAGDDGEEALGSGDVTLAAILGALLGWPLIWFGLFGGVLFAGLASLVIIAAMLLTRRYGRQALNVFIPYGPFFIVSAILVIYFPQWLRMIVPK